MLGRALRKGFSAPSSESLFARTGGLLTLSGSAVSPGTAMRAAAVYSATTLIAQTISALPIRFLEAGDENRVPRKPEEARALWDRPNPLQSTSSFIETSVMSLLLWGNIFNFPRYLNSGLVGELWPLDPDRVMNIDIIGTRDNPQGVRFELPDWQSLDNVTGEAPQMMHVPHITLPGRIRGISPIEQLAELVGMSLSAQEHAARFLGEGTHLSGVIETDANLEAAEAKALWEQFMLQHSGPKGSSVGVLSGSAKFKTLTMPPAELQFLEQMKYSDQKIAGIYRVPPHMIGDLERSTSWGTGIEEQTIQFVQHTLLPIITKLEDAFEAVLMRGTNYQVRFAVNGLLRGSMKDRAEFYRTLWNIGVLTADDILAFEDMPPLPDGVGKRTYVPLNVAPSDAPSEEVQQRELSMLALMRGGTE